MLTLTDIKNQKLETKKIDVEQWGGQLLIKKLSVADRDALAEIYDDEDLSKDAVLQTIIKSVVNEDDSLMFTDEHIDLLKQKDGEAIAHIYNEVVEYSGIAGGDDSDAVKP